MMLLPRFVRHNHRRAFAMVPCPHDYLSALSSALLSGFNPFGGLARMAPGPNAVEIVMLEWLRSLVGYDEQASGVFTSGGSASNLTCLAVACIHKLGQERGMGVAYLSTQTHPVLIRALRMLSIRDENIRLIDTDEHHEIDLLALERAIAQDLGAGLRPFCIIGNAGTTNSAAVDPLEAMAELCERYELWLHLDGAYGGPAILTERGKKVLAGLSAADSIALDPHKWLFQNYEMGIALIRQGSRLAQTYRLTAHYFEGFEEKRRMIDFKDRGLQLSRDVKALKLWMYLRQRGIAAIRRDIDHGMDSAEYAQALVESMNEWEVTTAAQLGVLTFSFRPVGLSDTLVDELNQSLVVRLNETGFASVNHTRLGGRAVLRMCTINPRTTRRDIQDTLGLLRGLAQGLKQEYEAQSKESTIQPEREEYLA